MLNQISPACAILFSFLFLLPWSEQKLFPEKGNSFPTVAPLCKSFLTSPSGSFAGSSQNSPFSQACLKGHCLPGAHSAGTWDLNGQVLPFPHFKQRRWDSKYHKPGKESIRLTTTTRAAHNNGDLLFGAFHTCGCTHFHFLSQVRNGLFLSKKPRVSVNNLIPGTSF